MDLLRQFEVQAEAVISSQGYTANEKGMERMRERCELADIAAFRFNAYASGVYIDWSSLTVRIYIRFPEAPDRSDPNFMRLVGMTERIDVEKCADGIQMIFVYPGTWARKEEKRAVE